MSPPRERIILRDVDAAAARRLSTEMAVPLTIATILTARGLTSVDECKTYFRPDLSRLHDPALFAGMDRAVERILAAVRGREHITVYGDYDVDGVTGTALLLRFLRSAGATVDYYLPNRLVEGYGLSEKGIRDIVERGTKLVITVDCGVTACEEAALAASLGVDVIITDHHEPKNEIPRAVAVIDPKVPGCGYPDANLAGVGVALKLCHALARAAGRSDEVWHQYLDMAALGTAADIVPLTGENRIIAAEGYRRMEQTANPGIRALLRARGLEGKHLSTHAIVFQIAPSINATGRLGDPRRGVELLLTDNPSSAEMFARELVAANDERRAIDAQVQEEALRWVEGHCDLSRDMGIVAGKRDWHVGVIGIVASKVVERFHRPSILFSLNDNGTAKGSGRGIAGFHLLQALDRCKDLLETYGGHAAAAGMTIDPAKIDAFRERFNEAVSAQVSMDDLVPRVAADARVTLADLTQKFVNIVKQMEPFGPGNMRPVLLCENLRHRSEPRIVGNGHLKMTLTDGRAVMDAIGFGFGSRLADVKGRDGLRVAFAIDENEWNGRVSLQMKIKGVAA